MRIRKICNKFYINAYTSKGYNRGFSLYRRDLSRAALQNYHVVINRGNDIISVVIYLNEVEHDFF